MALFLGFSQEDRKYKKMQGDLELFSYKKKRAPKGPFLLLKNKEMLPG